MIESGIMRIRHYTDKGLCHRLYRLTRLYIGTVQNRCKALYRGTAQNRGTGLYRGTALHRVIALNQCAASNRGGDRSEVLSMETTQNHGYDLRFSALCFHLLMETHTVLRCVGLNTLVVIDQPLPHAIEIRCLSELSPHHMIDRRCRAEPCRTFLIPS